MAGDARWNRLRRVAMLGLPAVFVIFCAGLLGVSGRPGFSAVGAAAITAVLGLNLVLVAGSAWAPQLAGRRRMAVVLCGWAAQLALVTGLLLGAVGVPVRWAVTGAVAIGVVAVTAYAPQLRKLAAMQRVQPLVVDSLHDARRIEAATGAPVDAPGLPAANRAIERLNRARALAMLAVREDDSDRVQEAVPLLRAALTDPALPPVVALSAADDLVNAESALAERSRDDRRYAQAIALLTEVVAENSDVPAGRAKLFGHRASYLAYQARRTAELLDGAQRDGDAATASDAERSLRDLYRATKRERVSAIDAAPPGSPLWAQEHALLGLLLCQGAHLGEEDDCDDGVRSIRRALDRRLGLSADLRRLTELNLANALIMQAQFDNEVTPGLAEADRILARLVRLGPPVEAPARKLRLELTATRDSLA